jgi:hypothetical protein
MNTKKVEICVKLLLLMRGAHIIGFVYLDITKKNIFDFGKILSFGLVLSFKTVF